MAKKKELKKRINSLKHELFVLREAIEAGNTQEINRQLKVHKIDKDTDKAIWMGDTTIDPEQTYDGLINQFELTEV